MPRLTLEDEAGNPVDSTAIQADAKVYLFYRGNWCPLCTGQIREIAALYHELAERGAQVILISPQPHESTRELADRFDVPFRFLVDPDNQNARLLGIDQPQGVPFGVKGYGPDTVMPTVVITDGAGTILFVDQTDNYRVRPEPATFLRVLEEQRVPA